MAVMGMNPMTSIRSALPPVGRHSLSLPATRRLLCNPLLTLGRSWLRVTKGMEDGMFSGLICDLKD